MSEGTAKPATCPICLGPAAYGHAAATRIGLGECGVEDIGTDHTRRLAGLFRRVGAAPSAERDRGEGGRAGDGEEQDDGRDTEVRPARVRQPTHWRPAMNARRGCRVLRLLEGAAAPRACAVGGMEPGREW